MPEDKPSEHVHFGAIDASAVVSSGQDDAVCHLHATRDWDGRAHAAGLSARFAIPICGPLRLINYTVLVQPPPPPPPPDEDTPMSLDLDSLPTAPSAPAGRLNPCSVSSIWRVCPDKKREFR